MNIIPTGPLPHHDVPDHDKNEGNAPEGPAITAAEIRGLQRQIMATFADLPSHCTLRRCRRHGRCLAVHTPCLKMFQGLAEERLLTLMRER